MAVPLFMKGYLNWGEFIPDSRLLDWMRGISADTEHIVAVLRFIPEIIRHSGVGKLPSINVLYESTLSSFDFKKKPRVLIQSFKDRALAVTKALIHLNQDSEEMSDQGGRSEEEGVGRGPQACIACNIHPG